MTPLGARKRVDDTVLDWFELVVEEHRREPFDVFHGSFRVQAGFEATYLGNYLHLPSVVSARGNNPERAVFYPSRAGHIIYALEHSSAVTTNASEPARKARVLIPGLQVTVIPNCVDREQFQPAFRNNALAESLNLINH